MSKLNDAELSRAVAERFFPGAPADKASGDCPVTFCERGVQVEGWIHEHKGTVCRWEPFDYANDEMWAFKIVTKLTADVWKFRLDVWQREDKSVVALAQFFAGLGGPGWSSESPVVARAICEAALKVNEKAQP